MGQAAWNKHDHDTQLFVSFQPISFTENISHLYKLLSVPLLTEWYQTFYVCLKVQRLNVSYCVLSLS